MNAVKCHEIRRELSAYLDGELSPSRRQVVAGHVAACAGCRQRLAELQALAAGVAAQPRAEPPADFLVGVRDRLERASGRSWRQALFDPVWVKGPIEAAALVAIALVAAVFLLPRSRPVVSDETALAFKARIQEPVATPAPSSTAAEAEGLGRSVESPAAVAALGDVRQDRAPSPPSATGPTGDAAVAGAREVDQLKADLAKPAATAPAPSSFGLATERLAEAKRQEALAPRQELAAAKPLGNEAATAGGSRGYSGPSREQLAGAVASAPAAPAVRPALVATITLPVADEPAARQYIADVATQVGGRLVGGVGDKYAPARPGVLGVVWVELPADRVEALRARLVGNAAAQKETRAAGGTVFLSSAADGSGAKAKKVTSQVASGTAESARADSRRAGAAPVVVVAVELQPTGQ